MRLEKKQYEMAKKRIEREILIDTYGKIHKYKGTLWEAYESISLHYQIAKALHPDMEYPADYLSKLGWVMVGSACYGNSSHKEPTQAQINTLWDLGYRGLNIIDVGRFKF